MSKKRVISRYGLPPVEELPSYFEELFGGSPELITFHLDDKLIAVQRKVESDDEVDDDFTMNVEEMLFRGELAELPDQSGTMLGRVQLASAFIRELGLFPSFILVGSRELFFACMGLQDSPFILGTPVYEITTYPDNRAAMAGSASSLAPVSGVTHAVCFGVSVS